jgi:predicted nucleic acid-binding protein
MSRVDEQSHLRAADDHLRLVVFLLSAQEDRIARERAAGLDTRLSGELLVTMQAIFRRFIAHHQAILDALDNERRSLLKAAWVRR